MTTTKVYRKKSCRCGCHGGDPWHKASYKRTVKLLSPTVGVVQLPFGARIVERPQYEVNGFATFGSWEFEPEETYQEGRARLGLVEEV